MDWYVYFTIFEGVFRMAVAKQILVSQLNRYYYFGWFR
jgi:hypothetical protein